MKLMSQVATHCERVESFGFQDGEFKIIRIFETPDRDPRTSARFETYPKLKAYLIKKPRYIINHETLWYAGEAGNRAAVPG